MKMRKLVFGYISDANPFTDRKAWSGSIYKIREGIEKAGYEVIWIRYKRRTFLERLCKFLFAIYKYAIGCGKSIAAGVHNPFIAKIYARTIDKREIERCDYLFYPGGAQIHRHLHTKVPYIYYADATFHIMEGYYWKDIASFSSKIANREEAIAIKGAYINIRSSQWAADSDTSFYGATKPSKVLEFGPNIDEDKIERKEMCNMSDNEVYNILFSGVDWERKGGSIAVQTIKKLNEIANKKFFLTIVGIEEIPEQYRGYENISVIGFLNKNDNKQLQKYMSLWKQSNIFLLPTQAECSATVFSEASAFGIPTYTYATGGTANYIIDGINGRTLPEGSTADDFALAILNDVKNGLLINFHEGCKAMYNDRLSWIAWSTRFNEIMSCHAFENCVSSQADN